MEGRVLQWQGAEWEPRGASRNLHLPVMLQASLKVSITTSTFPAEKAEAAVG